MISIRIELFEYIGDRENTIVRTVIERDNISNVLDEAHAELRAVLDAAVLSAWGQVAPQTET